MIKKLEVKLSKTKLILLFTSSIIFITGGIWMAVNPALFRSSFRQSNETLIIIIGIISSLFFGVCAFSIFRKLLDNSVGLTIDEKGIFDNSGATSLGQIFWTDIESITEYEVYRQKFIVINIKDPQSFISSQHNKFLRKTAEMNYKMSGSPINISANALKISFNELFKIITGTYNSFKK